MFYVSVIVFEFSTKLKRKKKGKLKNKKKNNFVSFTWKIEQFSWIFTSL